MAAGQRWGGVGWGGEGWGVGVVSRVHSGPLSCKLSICFDGKTEPEIKSLRPTCWTYFTKSLEDNLFLLFILKMIY